MPFNGPIARGTIHTSAVLALRLVVQAGTLLIVARLMGPESFGAFAGVASLAVVLGTLSTFGMQLVLLGAVSRDAGKREEVLARALPVTLSLGPLLLGAFVALCLTILGSLEVPLSVLLAIGIAEILLQPLVALAAWGLTAVGRPAESQLLSLLPLSLRLALAATILWISPQQPLTTYGYACLAASWIALVAVSATRLSPWLPTSRWRWPTRPQWREAGGYALVSMTTMAPAELDKTLAAGLLPGGEAGVYAAAQRAVGAITLPVSAMMLSALPRLYREGHHHSARTSRLLALIFSVSAAYGVALASLLWLVAPLAEPLFGASFHGIGEAVRWLCLAVPGMALRIAVGNALMATGTPWIRSTMELVGLLSLLPPAVILGGPMGATGMALAFACSQWAMVTTGIVALAVRKRRLRPFSSDDEKLRRTGD